MSTPEIAAAPAARINGIALHEAGETLTPEALRQRACTELLRQAAQAAGLLAADDPLPVEGAISEAAAAAIDAHLEAALLVSAPTEDDCRRHFAARTASFSTGERVRVRHILFAVTPGVDVVALRKRAEAALLDVRCHDGGAEDSFATTARTLSNCPSGVEGGDLGWLSREDCAPEFAKEIFAHAEIGVLPRLVHSRFGLHVVEALERRPGVIPSFESVQGAVSMVLLQQGFVTALRQYLRILVSLATIEGVCLEGSDTPLVQ
jgi:peptidyl-prolyl cis-trans isomerase C